MMSNATQPATAPAIPALRPRRTVYRNEHGETFAHIIRAELRGQPGGSRLTIHHEPTTGDALELSLSGEIWPATVRGNVDRRYAEAISYGQNLEQLRDAIARDLLTPAPDPLEDPHGVTLSPSEARDVARIWDRWHLNAMNGLCAHQERAGWTCTATGRYVIAGAARGDYGPDPWRCVDCRRYRWDCEAPCLEVPGSHPFTLARLVGPVAETRRDALRRRACECGALPNDPAHGYRSGSAWLVEPLPLGVIADVARIFGR